MTQVKHYKTYKDIQKVQDMPKGERLLSLKKMANHNLKVLESKGNAKTIVVDCVWVREQKSRYTDGFSIKAVWVFDTKEGKKEVEKTHSFYAYPPKQ